MAQPFTERQKQDWAEKIFQQQQSGLSIKRWCSLNQIQPQSFYSRLNLETAVQDDKVMQNFELESLPVGADHSQMVKAAHIGSDSSSKCCVNITSSTAVSRINQESEFTTS